MVTRATFLRKKAGKSLSQKHFSKGEGVSQSSQVHTTQQKEGTALFLFYKKYIKPIAVHIVIFCTMGQKWYAVFVHFEIFSTCTTILDGNFLAASLSAGVPDSPLFLFSFLSPPTLSPSIALPRPGRRKMSAHVPFPPSLLLI